MEAKAAMPTPPDDAWVQQSFGIDFAPYGDQPAAIGGI
jgi:hypothetical protein